jgi:hypothetical protein
MKCELRHGRVAVGTSVWQFEVSGEDASRGLSQTRAVKMFE